MKMKISYHLIPLLIYTFLFTFSTCHLHSHEEGHDHSHGEEGHSHAHSHGGHGHDHSMRADLREDGKIVLTQEQMETMSIALGDFTSMKINDFIPTTGMLDLPPNAYASINAKASGFITNSIKLLEGAYIKKGTVIATLENPEFIREQQHYFELTAELVYLYQEIDRQNKLVQANAGVIKNIQQLQSQINVKKVTQKGIAKRLKYIGINVNGLSADLMRESIPIIATHSGYITAIDMHDGQYVTPGEELIEIVDNSHLHLDLAVFEKDIANLKRGQKISYTVPALGPAIYDGDVHLISKEFNLENKTVNVHGHLATKIPTFIKDLFVDAKIWLNDATVQALPERAIVHEGDATYIYYAKNQLDEGTEFESIPVVTGQTDDGFTSVKLIEELPEGARIVTDGAYFVFAQSKAGELEHSH